MHAPSLTLLAALAAVLSFGHAALAPPPPSAVRYTVSDDADAEQYAVPKDLLLGAGVSAIQTEGAWNLDGRGESAQDHIMHSGFPGGAPFGFSPDAGPQHQHDVAADSYHRYKEDIAMAAKLKLKLYRFSFSWSRLLPKGNVTEPNESGVSFYHKFIQEIIDNGMEPLATLYHFDHPQTIEEEFNGWLGDEMPLKFEEYARFAFNEYSSKVKLWTTINECNMYCSYFIRSVDENGHSNTAKQLKCIRNNILAHARAYRAFKKDNHTGLVGFSALITFATPASTLPEDVYAADVYNQFQAGMLLHPVVYGDYPEAVKRYAVLLAPFSDEEKELIKGTTDYIGFNAYFHNVAAFRISSSQPSLAGNPGVVGLEFVPFVTSAINFPGGQNALFTEIDNGALRSSLVWAWQTYNLPLLVTENGFGDSYDLGTQDQKRAAYFSAYLRTLVKTMKDFKIKVIGYCAWSLIDSYEWSAGLTGRPFGLVHVDYQGGTLDRTLKDSASFWITMAESGVVPLVEVSTSVTAAASSLLVAAAAAASLLRQFA